MLALLLANADRAVSKEELLRHVWPETVVDENNLPRHISTLRKVLGELAGSATYIETVPGWGYRMTCAVQSLNAGAVTTPAALAPARGDLSDAGVQPTREAPSAEAVATARTRRATARALALAAAIVSLAGVAGWFLSGATSPPATPVRALRQLTHQPGHQEGPAWAPDGGSLAFTSDESGNLDIFVQRFTASEAIRLTSSEITIGNRPGPRMDGRSPFAPSATGAESTSCRRTAPRSDGSQTSATSRAGRQMDRRSWCRPVSPTKARPRGCFSWIR